MFSQHFRSFSFHYRSISFHFRLKPVLIFISLCFHFFVKFLFRSCFLLFPAPFLFPSQSILFLPFMSVLVPFRSVRWRSISAPFTFYFRPYWSVSFICVFTPFPFRSCSFRSFLTRSWGSVSFQCTSPPFAVYFFGLVLFHYFMAIWYVNGNMLE